LQSSNFPVENPIGMQVIEGNISLLIKEFKGLQIVFRVEIYNIGIVLSYWFNVDLILLPLIAVVH